MGEVVRQQPTSLSRDEERRKIIELEEERRRKEMKPGNVSRSGSRVSKIMGGKLKGSRLAGGGGETETDAQSQYSGHSAPNLMKSRYNSNGRVKRTGSSATTSSARQIISRKKMPGSLTSSVNSSESENGQSAISRATGASAASNRSIFLQTSPTLQGTGLGPCLLPIFKNRRKSRAQSPCWRLSRRQHLQKRRK